MDHRKVLLIGRVAPLRWPSSDEVIIEVKFTLNKLKNPNNQKGPTRTPKVWYNVFDLRGTCFHEIFCEIPENAQIVLCFFSASDLLEQEYMRSQLLWCTAQNLPFALVLNNKLEDDVDTTKLREQWDEIFENSRENFDLNNFVVPKDDLFFFCTNEVYTVLEETFEKMDLVDVRPILHVIIDGSVKLKSTLERELAQMGMKEVTSSALESLKIQGNIVSLNMPPGETVADDIIFTQPQWLAHLLSQLIYDPLTGSPVDALSAKAESTNILLLQKSMYAYESSGTLPKGCFNYIIENSIDLSNDLAEQISRSFEWHNLICCIGSTIDSDLQSKLNVPAMALTTAEYTNLDEDVEELIKLSYILAPALPQSVILQLVAALTNHFDRKVDIVEMFRNAFIFRAFEATFMITWEVKERRITFSLDKSCSEAMWYIFGKVTNALTLVFRKSFPGRDNLLITHLYRENPGSKGREDLRYLFDETDFASVVLSTNENSKELLRRKPIRVRSLVTSFFARSKSALSKFILYKSASAPSSFGPVLNRNRSIEKRLEKNNYGVFSPPRNIKVTNGNPYEDWIFVKKLGGGGSGVVNLYCRKKVFVAIKEFTNNKSGKLEFVEELNAFRMIADHEHVVKFLEAFRTMEGDRIALEYCSGGDLRQIWTTKDRYNEELVRDILLQVVSGLQFLYRMKVAHRDIKPENILVKNWDPTHVLLGDLNYAKSFGGGELGRTIVFTTKLGTRDYKAPEILSDSLKTHLMSDKVAYNHKCDIWSLGVVLYQLMSANQKPYQPTLEDLISLRESFVNEGDLQFQAAELEFRRIKDNEIGFAPADHWRNVSDEGRELIRQMLACEPSHRIDYPEILEHPWTQLDLSGRGDIFEQKSYEAQSETRLAGLFKVFQINTEAAKKWMFENNWYA